MIKILTFLTLIFSLTFSFASFSSEDHSDDHHAHEGEESHEEEHHEHGSGKAIGETKAIIDVDDKKGFKLSKEAIETLGIKTEILGGRELPESSIVVDRDIKGFYVLRGGYFKFLELSELGNLTPKDQVAVEGVGLLRITDVYSTDESEYGHGH